MQTLHDRANPRNKIHHLSGSAARKDKLVEAFARLDRHLDAREAKRKGKQVKPPIPYAVLRLRDIEKVMADLYGSVLPMGDDGALVDLSILIATVKVAGKPAINFMRKWVPWMPQDEAERFVAGVDINLAFLDADAIARCMGVNFATKERLKTRTIGAYDVPKAERKKIYRQRYEAKRKQAAKKKPALSPREKALINMVSTGRNMGDLAQRAARSALFRDLANVPLEVRRLVGRLVKAGHLGQRLEPRDRGGKEFYVWNEHIAQAEESAARRAKVENAPRETPIFAGSNRGAFSYVRTPKERCENSGCVKWDRWMIRWSPHRLRWGYGGATNLNQNLKGWHHEQRYQPRTISIRNSENGRRGGRQGRRPALDDALCRRA